MAHLLTLVHLDFDLRVEPRFVVLHLIGIQPHAGEFALEDFDGGVARVAVLVCVAGLLGGPPMDAVG